MNGDPYHVALLVESARLHLVTVQAGRDSEPFFSAMLEIRDARGHFGYKTLTNKEIKLRGIKDFLRSVYYGLGIRDINDFVLKVTQSALAERSKKKHGERFIEWLKSEDSSFCFPRAYYELKRVRSAIFLDRKTNRSSKYMSYKTAQFLYDHHPELLSEIGSDKKYKTVTACFYGEGLAEKQEILKPIKTYANPTNHQVAQLAESIFARIGQAKSKVLIAELSSLCSERKA